MPDFARMIDELFYSVIVLIAGVHWSLQEALLMAGYTVKLVNQWLIENAFMPIIAQTNDSLSLAIGVVFVVALLVLGITYLLAAFVGLSRRTDASSRLCCLASLAYLLAFAVVGRPENFYWGLMAAPLLPWGVAAAPRVVADWWEKAGFGLQAENTAGQASSGTR